MDGSDRQVLLLGRAVGQPNDLTIDYDKQHVYWIDGRKNTVWRMDLDGGLCLFSVDCVCLGFVIAFVLFLP